MDNVVCQSKCIFWRIHGIFGRQRIGLALFTENSIIIAKRGRKAYVGQPFPMDMAQDSLKYDEIKSCTKTWAQPYMNLQIELINGKECSLQIREANREDIEVFLQSKLRFYKNVIEKKHQIVSGDESEIYASIPSKHINGLPIPEGMDVTIVASKERFIFLHSNQEIGLSSDKIIDIAMKTESEVSSYLGSNIGNAFLGKMAFGNTGAILGAMPTQQQRITKTYFLVFTYQKNPGDAENQYISLLVSDSRAATALIERFKQNMPSEGAVQHIEL